MSEQARLGLLALFGTLVVGTLAAWAAVYANSRRIPSWLPLLGVTSFVGMLITSASFIVPPTTPITPTVSSEANMPIPTTLVAKRIASSTPVQALQAYFDYLNASSYDKAWQMLTSNYRDRHNSTGYAKFVEYWQAQGSVELKNLLLIEPSSVVNRSIVQVDANYLSQGRQATYHFLLFEDPEKGWTLDQYCDVDYVPKCSDQNF